MEKAAYPCSVTFKFAVYLFTNFTRILKNQKIQQKIVKIRKHLNKNKNARYILIISVNIFLSLTITT